MSKNSMHLVSTVKSGYSTKKLREFYRELVFPRIIDEKMLLLLRQGKISKWFSAIGQEAISVGAALAMEQEEYILPLHRNLGVFTARKVPLNRLFAQFQGKGSGFTKGRDRSFHFGTNPYHIVGMISHLGPQLCVADGIALASKLTDEEKVTLVFSGDGGTSEGDFHEALNVAAVWKLPVIFAVENNGYGLSTPSEEQFACERLSDRAKGYGMDGITIDGNNLLEVYETFDRFARSVRKNPRPVLIECLTFRMRGHEEASGMKYVPQKLLEHWQKRDPIQNYERYLISVGAIDEEFAKNVKAEILAEVDKALEEAFAEPLPVADTAQELSDVYAPHTFIAAVPTAGTKEEAKEMRLVDAVTDGLNEAMIKHDNLVLMGQDIAEYGGVFKVTDGFVQRFGRERVRNTPLCESAILGAALGLSIKGIKSMVEMQFADFVSCGFSQIINNFAKTHYRWGQNVDVVVRMPTGGGSAAGPFHSQSNEAWFVHTPGLKVVFPSNPYDAKGLLISSFEDPNPVIYFEHKALYRSVRGQVPVGYYNIPFGEASVVRAGERLSIITYGSGVHWALEVAELHPDWSLEIIDLRTLLPYDKESIAKSVRKTSRALVLHEATLTGGIAGEISAFIGEELFEYLDAPVIRCASLDTPVPFAAALEQNFFPKVRLEAELQRLLEY